MDEQQGTRAVPLERRTGIADGLRSWNADAATSELGTASAHLSTINSRTPARLAAGMQRQRPRLGGRCSSTQQSLLRSPAVDMTWPDNAVLTDPIGILRIARAGRGAASYLAYGTSSGRWAASSRVDRSDAGRSLGTSQGLELGPSVDAKAEGIRAAGRCEASAGGPRPSDVKGSSRGGRLLERRRGPPRGAVPRRGFSRSVPSSPVGAGSKDRPGGRRGERPERGPSAWGRGTAFPTLVTASAEGEKAVGAKVAPGGSKGIGRVVAAA
ncbi:hypothetical protein HK102_010503 [Quaeritorhiza haematococci]|nr:hypothetical protein HK102_010503 [Quaeritorhiza haematococci]